MSDSTSGQQLTVTDGLAPASDHISLTPSSGIVDDDDDNDYASGQWPVEDEQKWRRLPEDEALRIYVLVVGTLGVLTNGGLLAVIFSDKNLRRKDYLCLITNRILVDLTFELCLPTLQYVAMRQDSHSLLCQCAGALAAALAVASILCESTLSFNRFTCICHKQFHRRLQESRWTVPLICVVAWTCGGVSVVPYLFTGAVGRTAGMVCSAVIERRTLLVTLLSSYIFMLPAYAATAFFYWKIFWYIRQYQQRMISNSQRSRLQADREMLYYIGVTALFPLILELPMLVTIVVRLVRQDLVPVWATMLASMMFITCPAINPIISLALVKHLRLRFSVCLRGMLGKKTLVTPVNRINVTDARPADAGNTSGQVDTYD